MKDYQGTELYEGDWVALYYGYNELKTAKITKIKEHRAKLDVYEENEVRGLVITPTKWKYGECMIKLHASQVPIHY